MKLKNTLHTLFFFIIITVSNAQIVNIPDANFKTKLLQADATNTIAKDLSDNYFKIDANSDGEIQETEALQVSYLNVKGPDDYDSTLQIGTMQGLASFTNLTYLDCSQNKFTSLDMSSNSNLLYLDTGVNYYLTTVNVLSNINLETLIINTTQITTLNLVNNLNLKTLNSNNSNQFSGILDLSNNINLEHLNCYGMNLTSLDLTNNVNLLDLNCLSNQLSTLDLSNNINLVNLDVVTNQLTTLNLDNNINLETLDCYGNQLVALDLSNNTNLQSLRCSNNQLTSLDLSNNINLMTLDCVFNQLTSLNVDNCVNLTDLLCNSNQLGVLNVSDNIGLTNFNVAFNQLSSLNIDNNLNLESLVCTSNQLSNLSINNNVNLVSLTCNNNLLNSLNTFNNLNIEDLYLFNNQIFSIDTSNNLNLEVLNVGNNILTNVDVSNNVNLTSLGISGNQLTNIDLSLLTSLTNFDCSNTLISDLDLSNNPISWVSCFDNNNLSYLNIKNSVISDGEFEVYNVPNLEFVCADDSEVSFVTNYFNNVSVNANVNSYCSFTPGGDYNTITGNITFDSQNDGCDSNDDPFPFIKININDGIETGSTFTNTSGVYAFYTQDGNFTVTPDIENPTFFNTSPINATINFPDTNNNVVIQDFCITANGVHPDVEIVIAPIIQAQPGFDAEYLITYKNKGNQALSGDFSFEYDDTVLDFVSSTEIPTTQATGLLTWNYQSLLPFESRSVYVTLNVNGPTETSAVNIGDELSFSAIINPIAGDELPADNQYNYVQTVVGSYDPNDITCVEGDIVSPTEIGGYLHYVINFENTGTAPAENIVVKAEIDPTQFDVNTLRLLSSSHNADVRVSNNIVEIIFESIYLNSGGHGNILLKIQTQNTLLEESTVTKNAEIFFDYNFPIETNMASTTFHLLSNAEFEMDNSISLFPNPVKDVLTISAKENIKSVALYDVQGRLLLTKINSKNEIKIDLSTRASGIYFLKTTTIKGTSVEKVIKD